MRLQTALDGPHNGDDEERKGDRRENGAGEIDRSEDRDYRDESGCGTKTRLGPHRAPRSCERDKHTQRRATAGPIAPLASVPGFAR